MRKTLVLFVLLLAATAMVCRSDDDDDKDSSWTDWAKDKLTGAFQGDQVKETAHNVANKASDATSDSVDFVTDKAGEAEDAAVETAKKLSGN